MVDVVAAAKSTATSVKLVAQKTAELPGLIEDGLRRCRVEEKTVGDWWVGWLGWLVKGGEGWGLRVVKSGWFSFRLVKVC